MKMYPRINYEMSEEDEKELLKACQPTPSMMIGNYTPSTPQENANRAWERLGKKMGFDHMTVSPIEGKSTRFFTAVPNETDYQRNERMEKEKEEKKVKEIEYLKKEIIEKQVKLDVLLDGGIK